ncbi:MAG: DUF5652 family protein [Candidatus Staskawiczbacteria bacterium]|nr:DUF5652 family protein [Candidatus Staskawiczbacteria bacterium]
MITPKEQQLIDYAHFLNTHPLFVCLLVVLAIWTIIWKGLALWKAAGNKSKPWFIVLLLLNTVGILEIIYIFFFSKKKEVSK